MPKQLICDIKEGDLFCDYIQVEEAQLFNFKNRPGYYALFTFSDRTGSIRGVSWDNGEENFRAFPPGTIVKVRGKVVSHNNTPQINIEKIAADKDNKHDPADFLPVSSLDIETLFHDLIEAVTSVQNPHLKALLTSYFMDEDFAHKFQRCPAAKSVHHSYIGGLLEHTRNCSKLVDAICDIYPQLNRDLLMTATLIHDIGKTAEMTYERRIDYTDQGRLLGHITIGYTMILDRVRTIPDFPPLLADELLHMILSHHGENSTGSPKRPKTPEACALHFLENLDAQTKRFIQIVENSTNRVRNTNWTTYDRLLERYLYIRPADDDSTTIEE